LGNNTEGDVPMSTLEAEMAKIPARVDAGIAWLDSAPADLAKRLKDGVSLANWRNHIVVSDINLGSCTDCILGQLLGEYDCDAIDFDLAIERGFNIDDDSIDGKDLEYYAALDDEWKRRLAA
jgi:hypothetical protein